MTPLGWLLYYLDDGGMHKDENGGYKTSQSVLYICSTKEKLRVELIKELKSYGYNFINSNTDIRLSDKVQIASFISGMILPFKHIIPTCMEYKYSMKI